MRYAIIENGVVANIAKADEAFAQEQGWIAAGEADKGWTYANGVFTAPEPEVTEAPAAPTKEELAAQIAALSAQIQALE